MNKLNKIKKTPKAYLKPTSHISHLTSNKGITLTSLVIYITVMFVVLAMITRVITHFRNNMAEVADVTFETEFEKLNLYLLDEAKKTGNKIAKIEGNEIKDQSYQQIEYIESTGTQILNTGVNVLNGNCYLNAVMQSTMTKQPNATGMFISVGLYGGQYIIQSGSNWSLGTTPRLPATDKSTFEMTIDTEKKSIYGKLNNLDFVQGYSNTSGLGTICLLGKSSYCAYGKLFSCQIKQNDILVRDLIPCYRISDEKIGMYDLVNSEFYDNKGTGEFKAGSKINQQIYFSSGNKYTYNAEDKTIYLNDNIKLCENVESCLFKKSLTDNEKEIIEITITIKDTTKTLKYVMNDAKPENEIIEADYTNSIIAKEYTVSANSVTINNTVGQNVINYRISGNCYQEGTPTPESPIEVQCVGDLVTDINDENYGKFLIPITATNGEKTETINIYLDEPLRSITYGSQTATDYIDFETKQVVRNVWRTNIDGNEKWGLNRDRKDGASITIRSVVLEKRKLFEAVVLSNHYKNFYTLWNYNDKDTNYAWKISDYGGTGIIISLDNKTIGVPLEALEENVGEGRNSRTQKVTDYIKTHNFYVIYSIAEPDIQTIDLPELPSFRGTTTYTVGTSLAPSNLYVKVPINDL